MSKRVDVEDRYIRGAETGTAECGHFCRFEDKKCCYCSSRRTRRFYCEDCRYRLGFESAKSRAR